MKKLLFTTSILALIGAGNNTTPGWKVDEQGHIVLKDGNPVYIDTAGREMTVGGDTISNANRDGKVQRERAEAAEAKLEAFKDIDPVVARKAIDTVGKLDAKKLLDAGEVDKLKDQIKAEFTNQLGEKDKALGTLQTRIDGMLVDGVFANSQFVRDSIAVPPDMFQATFRDRFKIEDGKVTAYDKAGNRLMSKSRVGEYAEPDEALQLLVDAHPQKETILKADLGSGSGNQGGGGGKGQGRILKRSELQQLNPAQQAESMAKVRTGEMKLID